MIDRNARDKFSELLRHFAAGNLTNDQYENAATLILDTANPNDHSLWEIFHAAWFLYDDIWVHRLRKKYALTQEGRRAFARWMVFLHSDCEYEWPTKHPFFERNFERRMRSLGTWDLWPFIREADYQSAISNPRLLGAKSQ